MENGCSFYMFHFPFTMKNEINDMYTDRDTYSNKLQLLIAWQNCVKRLTSFR
jgi:hypothetical protein